MNIQLILVLEDILNNCIKWLFLYFFHLNKKFIHPKLNSDRLVIFIKLLYNIS